MKTRAIVNDILKTGSTFTVPEVLSFIDEIQKEMLLGRFEFLEVIDETTGEYPVVSLTTTKRYNITIANGFPFDGSIISEVRNEEGKTIRVRKHEATETEPAYFILREDVSGSVTVIYYRKPGTIATVNNELEVPPRYHINTVMIGVKGLIEDRLYGKSTTLDDFRHRLLPKFQAEMMYVSEDDDEVFIRETYSG